MATPTSSVSISPRSSERNSRRSAVLKLSENKKVRVAYYPGVKPIYVLSGENDRARLQSIFNKSFEAATELADPSLVKFTEKEAAPVQSVTTTMKNAEAIINDKPIKGKIKIIRLNDAHEIRVFVPYRQFTLKDGGVIALMVLLSFIFIIPFTIYTVRRLLNP